MADVKWIKIATDIFSDEKIMLIESMPEADGIITIWFKLLCLAGKQNNNGIFTLNDRLAYTDEMLATIFRRPLNTVRLALDTFETFGMIERYDGIITIPNWEKHQNIEGLDKIREQTRQRVAKCRAKQKEEQELLECNVTVTQRNATDKNREDKNRLDNKRFIKPSLEEVQFYINEKSLNVDAQTFIDYYESNGWKVGKNPMKDWKATLRRWNSTQKQKTDNNSFNKYEKREIDYTDLERRLLQ